ncbi:MAG: MraY family glycosyltransferase [Mariprofundus sp.]
MLHRVQIMDVPNLRSSHITPVPRGGGIAIVVTFLLGIVAIYLMGDKTLLGERYYWAFLGSAILIAGISFYDDISGKSFQVKLATQAIAAIIVVLSGIVVEHAFFPYIGLVQFGFAGVLLTMIWIVGLTNAYNFMDGIDGLAASTAVITSLFFAYITFDQGSLFIYICSYTVMAGALGFLLFNRPPARIFMGDVGSAFLGFIFAVMAIIAAYYDHSHTSLLVIPLLLFHFLYDTSFTLVRRAMAGEHLATAHRGHLYQLLTRMGMSHARVTCYYAILGFIQGGAAIGMVNIAGSSRVWIFLPFIVAYSLLAGMIIRRAGRKGLL